MTVESGRAVDVPEAVAASALAHGRLNLLDPNLWESGFPRAEFAELRAQTPVYWNAQPDETNPFEDGGLWAITTHADVKAVARDTDAWSTNANGAIPVFPAIATRESIEPSKALLINHDAPTHTRLRKIVSRLFTPRNVADLEERLRRSARFIVEQAALEDEGDFVADIASRLPIEAIADLIGIPEEDRQQVFYWADSLIAAEDPDVGIDPLLASTNLLGYAYQLAEDRRREPHDDIVTMLVNADVDGEALTELEFGYFVLFLAIAGNETTRNAATHGINAFFDNPAQWELFVRERPASTADEIIRFASPVIATQRTARHDVVVNGVTIGAGQRVALFYGSANYDENVFDNPGAFDITRNPNPHLGFGGNGPHICLGAALARLELRIMFDAIADIVPDIAKAGEPRRLRSAFVNGLKSLPVRYH